MTKNKINSQFDSLIIGRNSVMEALKSGRYINHIWVLEGTPSGSLKAIIAKAKGQGIPVKTCVRKNLDSIALGENHQGVIASASLKKYSSLDDILNLAQSLGQPPFIIIADCIEDPQNLGSIIRTAECSGAHGLIVPKRHCPGLTSAVHKASAGALEHVLISREANICYAIDKLKKLNIWVYGADMGGEMWYKQDLSGPIALVIGAEGRGISNLVKQKCDMLLSLPMLGKISSLNASAATAVIAYEICRQRIEHKRV